MNHAMIIIGLIILLAALLHGLTGFGFGLTAMPLLLFLMPFPDAVVVVALLTLVVVVLQFIRHRAHYSWRNGLWLLIGSVVGVPLGVYGLVHVPKVILLHTLGAAMCLIAINELALLGDRRFRLPTWTAFPCGVISGSFSGAFNMGGPMLVVYTYAQPWSKEQIVVLLQVIFGVTGLMRVASLWRADLIRPDLLRLGGWLVVPLVGGLLVGTYVFRNVPDRHFKKGVCVALGVLGLKYLLLG